MAENKVLLVQCKECQQYKFCLCLGVQVDEDEMDAFLVCPGYELEDDSEDDSWVY